MNAKLLLIAGLAIASMLTLLPVMAATTAEASASSSAKRNFTVQLSGGEEVPPVDTQARGVAVFQLSKDGTELSYKLIVSNIENVTAAHIHLAPAGENGPAVAFLFPGPSSGERSDGVLAEGTLTDADLFSALAGKSISDLVDEIRAGNAYVNVHTSQNPGGEIRGQIS